MTVTHCQLRCLRLCSLSEVAIEENEVAIEESEVAIDENEVAIDVSMSGVSILRSFYNLRSFFLLGVVMLLCMNTATKHLKEKIFKGTVKRDGRGV